MPLSGDALEATLSELMNFQLFAGFSRDVVRDLCAGGKIKVNAHREVLFREGEDAAFFGIVLSGAYKLFRISHAGDDAIIYFTAPGDVLAALIMQQKDAVYPLSISAMGPSRVLLLHRDVYLHSWITRPEIVVRIQNLLSTRMSRFRNLRMMQRAPLASKVASLLCELLSKDKSRNDLSIPLPLTRKEIADSLGVTVESVIRIMSEWEKTGVISTQDHMIRVDQPEVIVQIVNAQSG